MPPTGGSRNGRGDIVTVKVIVLGASGMLGHMVTDYLSRNPEIEVVASVRTIAMGEKGLGQLPNITWMTFEAQENNKFRETLHYLQASWLINCIGQTRHHIHDDQRGDVAEAINVNTLFPSYLDQAAMENNTKVLGITTDCVFSGKEGGCTENSPHDALDAYGKTKSLGELLAPNTHWLRCSLIGPQLRGKEYLLEWVLGQPQGAVVKGWIDHLWNGVTTLQWAKFAEAIVLGKFDPPHLLHVVPYDFMDKGTLVRYISKGYGRDDLTVTQTITGQHSDLRLSTDFNNLVTDLWKATGQSGPDGIPEMLDDLVSYERKLTEL